MAALAVDQHQGVIRRQATKIGRADDRRGVADGLYVHVIRRNDITDEVLQVRIALVLEIFAAQYVHGRGRILDRACLCACTGRDDLLDRLFLRENLLR